MAIPEAGGNVWQVGNMNGTHNISQIPDSEQREQTSALDSEDEREAPRPKRPIVGFTLCRVRLLDWEAKWSSIKDLLDGLQKSGLISGDREDQIDPRSFVVQEKVAHYSEERTVIEITF